MLIVFAGLLVASATPSEHRTLAICEVGRVALRDLPSVARQEGAETFYAEVQPGRDNLIEACPALRQDLPASYPIANDDARARAGAQRATPPALIAMIHVPHVSEDLKSATVEMGYHCSGLCGASFVAHYILTSHGWARDGEIRVTSVS